ncbi:hypothetical protein Clacol_010209 [Clathrus columnatus]|uniref:Uncharacterized protein n=1 Tax=Clathrus columnatus TaxID=1419009 RepID=A0AAV5AN97_9AGAM|nr:hypothetical protein Clacol_010209 [Clathrus columnatus]
MTSLQLPTPEKYRFLNYTSLTTEIINVFPILTALLVDDAVPKSVRTAVFGLLKDLSKHESLKNERIIENATRIIIQTSKDRNPNKRWIAVEWLPVLLELPDLHDRLRETIPHLISYLTDKDPVVRLSAVQTLAVFAENETFYDIIMSQITPIFDLLSNSNNNPDTAMRHNVIQLFMEYVKYPSKLHELVIRALPRFKDLLCSSSAFLRSSALKILENCAVFPWLHSLIITTTQSALSEMEQLNPTDQNQKFLQKLKQHADLQYLRGVSMKSVEEYIMRVRSWEKPIRILNMDILERLASVAPLEPSFSDKLPKLLSGLSQYDPEILLELLNPDISKYTSLRKLTTSNLQALISSNFFSLAQPKVLSQDCPNIGAIEPYILYHPTMVLQNSIPGLVKRALEGDRDMLFVVVELLKNETLHKSFADSSTLTIILQTIFDYPQPDADSESSKQSRKKYRQFIDTSINGARMSITQAHHYSISSMLEWAILSREAGEYGNIVENDPWSLDSESDLIIKCHVKEDSQLSMSGNKIWDKRLGLGVRTFRNFQREFEPPVIRILVEFMKRPILYTALKSFNITSTQSFSLPSLLRFHINKNYPYFDSKILSVWIYTIRELFDYDMYPHLYHDLNHVVDMVRNSLFSGFTAPSASASCRVSSVLLLGEVIKNELRTRTKLSSNYNNIHLDPNTESSILLTLHAIETALKDGDINVRICAIRVFEKIMGDGVYYETDSEERGTITSIFTNFVGGRVIPKLMDILSDKFESVDIRHLVAKCLEGYAGYNGLHMHLIHTIPSLLTLLQPTSDDDGNKIQNQIIPVVLGVLITYGRYATLWSSIRDALADRANISQKAYTIYEPMAILGADEFERYPFVKQPFLDAVSAVFNVLDVVLDPEEEEEEEEEEKESRMDSEEENKDQKRDEVKKDKNEKKKPEKSTKTEDTYPSLPSQISTLKGMMELIKYPSLFTSPSSSVTSESSVSLNDILTRYAIILEDKPQEVDDEDEEKLEKGKRKSNSFNESENYQETRIVPTRNKSQELKTNDSKKSKSKSKSEVRPIHPLLRYQAICGLYDYDFFPKIVDIVGDVLKGSDSNLVIGKVIDALVHVILEGDPGSSKVLVSSLFDMLLNADGDDSESRRISLIRIIGASLKV